MTEAQKNEFAAVIMKDYGVQIGKDDEILPILHLMYQMTFQYKRTVDEQQKSIKGLEKMLTEKLNQMEILIKQTQEKKEEPVMPVQNPTMNIFGWKLQGRSFAAVNDFLAFFLFIELIIAAIFLVIRYS